MWNKVKDSNFLISFKYEEVVVVSVSNLITVWTKSWSSRMEFIDCLRASNPFLEMTDNDFLLSKGVSTLSNINEAKKVEISVHANGKLALSISRPFQYPFRINIELEEGSKEFFFNNITLPLLKTVNGLARSQNELCELLTRKDQEINEYKEEGGRIALRHLKTPKFDQVEHLSKHTSLRAHFSFDEFPSTTLVKQEDASNVIIKQDPDEDVKSEEIDEEINTNIKVEQELHSSQNISPKKKRKKLPV